MFPNSISYNSYNNMPGNEDEKNYLRILLDTWKHLPDLFHVYKFQVLMR